MDHTHTRSPLTPAPASERFHALDTLRGFALLGILVPNIWYFAWPMIVAIAPTEVMSDSDANGLAHTLTSTVFLGKFMFIFALLFGGGVVMYGRKYDTENEQGRHSAPLTHGAALWHARCSILLAIGMAHAYLFWYGDILSFYALAGLTGLWWVRRLPATLQIWGGLGLYLSSITLLIGFALLGYWAFSSGRIAYEELTPVAPDREIEGYLGTFTDALRARFLATLQSQLFLGVLIVPSLWGIMCLGMGLTRTGLLTGERSLRLYAQLALVLIPIGLGLTMLAYTLSVVAFDPVPGFVWQAMAQPVGIPLALGYASLVIAISKARVLRPLSYPLACVGRMALTNYLTQTLVCTTLFYGYGLGRFAQIEFPALWGVVAGVWAFNICFSMLWLRFFRMGPAEWLWRCLTYRRLLSIR